MPILFLSTNLGRQGLWIRFLNNTLISLIHTQSLQCCFNNRCFAVELPWINHQTFVKYHWIIAFDLNTSTVCYFAHELTITVKTNVKIGRNVLWIDHRQSFMSLFVRYQCLNYKLPSFAFTFKSKICSWFNQFRISQYIVCLVKVYSGFSINYQNPHAVVLCQL